MHRNEDSGQAWTFELSEVFGETEHRVEPCGVSHVEIVIG